MALLSSAIHSVKYATNIGELFYIHVKIVLVYF